MGAALQGILAQVEELVRRPVERGARMRAFVDIADRTAKPVHDKTLEAFLARAERKGFRAGCRDFGQRDQPRAGRWLVRAQDGGHTLTVTLGLDPRVPFKRDARVKPGDRKSTRLNSSH